MEYQLKRLGPQSKIHLLSVSENTDNVWIAGRGSHCHIFTRSSFASRKHFSITYANKTFFIHDHGSSNGTFLNDEKMTPLRKYPLNLNSTIGVGVSSIFQDEPDCIVFIFELNQQERIYEVEKNENVDAAAANNTIEIVEDDIEDCFPIQEHNTGKKNLELHLGKVNPNVATIEVQPECSERLHSTVQSSKDVHSRADSNVTGKEIEVLEVLESSSSGSKYGESSSEDKETDSTGIVIYSISKVNNEVKIEKHTNLNPTERNEFYERYYKVEDEKTNLQKTVDFNIHEDDTHKPPFLNIVKSEDQYPPPVDDELILISDSDDDCPMVPNSEVISRDLDSNKTLQDDDDDDIIFLDSVTRSEENCTIIPEIKIEEDDDFTETDKKWMVKLLKTKEERDSFILSQRDDNSNEVLVDDGRTWTDFVNNYDAEIGQVLVEEKPVELLQDKNLGVGDDKGDKLNVLNETENSEKLTATEMTSTADNFTSAAIESDKERDVSQKIATNLDIESSKLPSMELFREDVNVEKKKRISILESGNFEEDVPIPVENKQKLSTSKPKEPKLAAEKSVGRNVLKTAPILNYNKFEDMLKRKRKKKKKTLELLPYERERIKKARKRKLKELSLRDAATNLKEDSYQPKHAPLKVKITRKNRSQFLCERIIDDAKEQAKKSNLHNEKFGEEDKMIDAAIHTNENPFERYDRSELHTSSNGFIKMIDKIDEITSRNEVLNTESVENTLVTSNNIELPPAPSVDETRNIVLQQEDRPLLKSCLRKYGFAFLKRKPLVAVKRVRFDNSTDVRYFEVESNMRPTHSVSQSRSRYTQLGHLRFRNVLLEICSWNVLWLEEYINFDDEEFPLPFRNKEIRFVQNRYSSHEEYVKTFIPLLLMELWHVITEKWRNIKHELRPFVAVLKSYECPKEDVTHKMGILSCEVLSEHGNSPLVKEGDLIIIQMLRPFLATEDTTSTSSTSLNRIFGYIERKIMEPLYNNYFHATVPHSSNGEIKKMNLTIVVKWYSQLPSYIDSEVQIFVLHNITLDLGLCRAVCHMNYSPLCKQLLVPNRPYNGFQSNYAKENIHFLGPLDDAQKELVWKLMSSCNNRDYNVLQIQGGPGTGKTHAMIAFIIHTLSEKELNGETPKILYCSHSNEIVDEVALKLKNYRKTLYHQSRYKLVRVGNMKLMKPSVRDISSFQFALQNEYNGTIGRQISDLDRKIKQLATELEGPYNNYSERDVKMKSAQLHEHVKQREALRNSKTDFLQKQPSLEAESYIIENADVICTTCTCSGSSRMINAFRRICSKTPRKKIICIIDGAMQIIEPETIIPLLLGVTHLILVGDSRQLLPRPRSRRVQNLGLCQSLFWRLCNAFGKVKCSTSPVCTLNIQYRMSPRIFSIPNKIFYKNSIIYGIHGRNECPVQEFLVLIDSQAESISEEESRAHLLTSAGLVTIEILNVTNSSKIPFKVGIITCSDEQALFLRTKMNQRLPDSSLSLIEIDSIEKVQGSEYDIVLFIFDANMCCSFRANVALTRAKTSLLILTVEPKCVRDNKFLAKLIQEAAARKAINHITSETTATMLRKMVSTCHWKQ